MNKILYFLLYIYFKAFAMLQIQFINTKYYQQINYDLSSLTKYPTEGLQSFDFSNKLFIF